MSRGPIVRVPYFLATGVFVLFTFCAAALAQIHPSEPAVNLGDTSFLDGVAGPGSLVEEIGDGYRSTKIADSWARTSSMVAAIYAISGITHIAWLSRRRIFKAWYGLEIVPTPAYVHAGRQGRAGGWGDLTVSPLILQWGEQQIGRIRVQQRFVFDFGLPTGDYQRSSSVNLGSNTFAVHPYYAITVFPAKHWETSWRIHYLWNSVNHSPPLDTGARSMQAGQAVHFNATVGYALPRGLWIGANAYYLKQVTNPYIDGVQLADSPEQVGAIGPGMMWDWGRFLLFVNAYHELGAVNRPEGDKVVLRFMWVPGRKATHDKAN